MGMTDIRRRIDVVDNQLTELFCERMRLAAQAGAAKRRLGLPLNDDVREREICMRAAQLAGKELAPYAWQFFKSLFIIAKDYQVHQPALEKQPEADDKQAKS